MTYDADETRCESCGQPTPRLDPPAETELCNACWRADEAAAAIVASNDLIVVQHVADWLVNGNDPRR